MSKPIDAALLASARKMIAQAHWLGLATVTPDGEPSVSYVPFALLDEGLGIAVSALAVHTIHLAARPVASVLIVGPPAADDDPFARPRLTIDARAHDASGSPSAPPIWDALARRNGPTVAVLRSLPDFRPFLLEPLRGRLILGFAEATDLDGPALATLLRS